MFFRVLVVVCAALWPSVAFAQTNGLLPAVNANVGQLTAPILGSAGPAAAPPASSPVAPAPNSSATITINVPDLTVSVAPASAAAPIDPSVSDAAPPISDMSADPSLTDSPDAASSDSSDSAAAAPDISAAPSVSPAEAALLDLTNADRVAQGLVPLQFDPALLPIARARAQAQVGSPTLSHVDSSGALAFVGLLAQAGIHYALAGDLARVSNSDIAGAQQAEPALMASPTHRANILEPTFRVAAMGTALDTNGRTVFAEIYRTA